MTTMTIDNERKIPAATRKKLISLTRDIAKGQDSAVERARIFRDLHDAGFSFTEIGRSCDITKQAAQSAVSRKSFHDK